MFGRTRGTEHVAGGRRSVCAHGDPNPEPRLAASATAEAPTLDALPPPSPIVCSPSPPWTDSSKEKAAKAVKEEESVAALEAIEAKMSIELAMYAPEGLQSHRPSPASHRTVWPSLVRSGATEPSSVRSLRGYRTNGGRWMQRRGGRRLQGVRRRRRRAHRRDETERRRSVRARAASASLA